MFPPLLFAHPLRVTVTFFSGSLVKGIDGFGLSWYHAINGVFISFHLSHLYVCRFGSFLLFNEQGLGNLLGYPERSQTDLVLVKKCLMGFHRAVILMNLLLQFLWIVWAQPALRKDLLPWPKMRSFHQQISQINIFLTTYLAWWGKKNPSLGRSSWWSGFCKYRTLQYSIGTCSLT